ncbi:hypothetical protein ABIE26_004365 [Pedobacter africanus]|uniref:Uncharacterized protein n=1 Tax=Pedobacter africanus TaxID=151894 RepID=A0ACC6L2K6_9SPHI|nr:hypothetical protein [Pedobacter africanus]MDR6785655.1 hypothetical protein [Pedobacter africanus]
MSVIEKLSTSLGRRDEVPNQELARQIVQKKDTNAVQELMSNLNHKSKAIQSDCLKVIYEIGALEPKMIAGNADELVALLSSKNNRLQWGAMTALNAIVLEMPGLIFEQLPLLVAVAEKGSVITKDHLMAILIKLCSIPEYAASAFSLFNEQLMSSATNQLPMYAENAVPVINESNKAVFIKTLNSRIDEIEKESKRKRVEKVIKKLFASRIV